MDYEGFNIDYNNKILFLEDTEDLRGIVKFISAMEQRGVFRQINGLILGNCSGLENQRDLESFIRFILNDYSFPIIQIGELGHNVENYSFPIGALAKMDTKREMIIFN